MLYRATVWMTPLDLDHAPVHARQSRTVRVLFADTEEHFKDIITEEFADRQHKYSVEFGPISRIYAEHTP